MVWNCHYLYTLSCHGYTGSNLMRSFVSERLPFLCDWSCGASRRRIYPLTFVFVNFDSKAQRTKSESSKVDLDAAVIRHVAGKKTPPQGALRVGKAWSSLHWRPFMACVQYKLPDNIIVIMMRLQTNDS